MKNKRMIPHEPVPLPRRSALRRRAVATVMALAISLLAWAADSASFRPRHTIRVEFRPAKVLPTNPFLRDHSGYGPSLPLNRDLSFHLKYGFAADPESRVGRLYPYTFQGLGLSYEGFDNRREVGRPLTLYLFQTSRVARIAPWLSLDYEWNFGASLGWKPFDPETNPYNRVVGSRINAYIDVGFFLNARLSDRVRLTLGGGVTHFSNGNTHLPNSGVNTAGGRIGLVYAFQPELRERVRRIALPEMEQGFWRRMGLDVVIYGAFRAKGVASDEGAYILPGRFCIAGLNLNPMYTFNRFLRAGFSIDGQYDESANIYTHDPLTGPDPRFYRPPLREQIGLGLSARGEFTMPYFAINFGIGHNVIGRRGDLGGLYQVLALKIAVVRGLFVHVGYQLRDFHEPKNLMLGLGYRIGR